MQKRVKMVDIARAAQVSQTTVSLVLNRTPNVRIAEDTRQRVIQVARDLGYVPGPALDAPTHPVFGVLINEISATYPINLIDGLQAITDASGSQLLIQVTGGLPDHERAALDNFTRLGVAGVIYASTYTAVVEPVAELARFPHVLLNCRRKGRTGISVMPAERTGGYVAGQHLIDIGCRRLAIITGDPWQDASINRLTGFRRALKDNRLDHDARYERIGDWSHASGRLATEMLLALPEPPDGIFCQNDIMARGALAAIKAAGKRVGPDIAVIGYDDRDFARDLEPPLTSITLPHAEMAERAMAYLLQHATSARNGSQTVRGTLIVRSSTNRSLTAV